MAKLREAGSPEV